jgi:hypothetical protein
MLMNKLRILNSTDQNYPDPFPIDTFTQAAITTYMRSVGKCPVTQFAAQFLAHDFLPPVFFFNSTIINK